MIKLEHLSRDDLLQIGRDTGNSFYQDEGAYRKLLTQDECIAYFTACIEACYEINALYTVSEKQEGYLAFWHKKDKPNMAGRLADYMGRDALIKFMNGLRGWPGFERCYADTQDYLSVFLVSVCNGCKGKGFSRKIMEYPFNIAKKEEIPCYLDTDSKKKADIYGHLGMKVKRHKILDNGIEMYTMMYDGKEQ